MIFVIFVFFIYFVLIYFLVKNFVTYHWHKLITNAIFLYHVSVESILEIDIREKIVSYNDAESYDSTLFRFWDWGYKHILPKEKFEIIKPYIKKAKRMRKDKMTI